MYRTNLKYTVLAKINGPGKFNKTIEPWMIGPVWINYGPRTVPKKSGPKKRTRDRTIPERRSRQPCYKMLCRTFPLKVNRYSNKTRRSKRCIAHLLVDRVLFINDHILLIKTVYFVGSFNLPYDLNYNYYFYKKFPINISN